ncbi:MAG: LamG domain-containing protein [Patescibacteria group bacterium]
MRTKIIYFSIISLVLIAGIVVWFNYDWFKLVFAAGNDSNTVSLLHMNGTDGSTTFTDNAAGGTHTWTANGNAQIDTAQSKFGGASGLFDGVNDNLSTPDSDDWNFGAGDFTIDFWVRFNTVLGAGQVMGFWDVEDVSGYYQQMKVYYNAPNSWYFHFAVSKVGGGALTLEREVTTLVTGQWYHMALTRNGDSWRWFRDGVQMGSTGTVSGTQDNVADTVYIGAWEDLSNDFDGWLDEFRVSKGLARWTANFTPPTCEYNGGCGPPPKVPDIMVFE